MFCIVRFTSREVSAATRLEQSSGRSVPDNVGSCAHVALFLHHVSDIPFPKAFLLSDGHRSSRMSMALIPLAPTMATATCSWSASMCTTTRPQVEGMCLVLS